MFTPTKKKKKEEVTFFHSKLLPDNSESFTS